MLNNKCNPDIIPIRFHIPHYGLIEYTFPAMDLAHIPNFWFIDPIDHSQSALTILQLWDD